MSDHININSLSIRSSDVEPKNKGDRKCAPDKILNNGSCVDVNVLISMASAYNKEFPNKKIKLNKNLDTINPNKYKKYLVKQFNNRLSDICDTQRCWVKQRFVKKMKKYMVHELKKNTFRPNGPSGKFDWLNTYNIDNVMEQYENKYDDFKYFGAVPIDFQNLSQLEIAHFDLDRLYKDGIRRSGVIFNLDEHYKSGSHWVSLYMDFDKRQIYFSDSYGFRPEKRIRKFMRNVANQIRDKFGSVHMEYNKIRHQYSSSECGVYSINFIVRLLKNESFETLVSKRMSDEQINRCREIYFNNVDFKK